MISVDLSQLRTAEHLAVEADLARWAEIMAERERRMVADFIWQGLAFQMDPRSLQFVERAQGNAMAAIFAGAQAGDLRWHGQNGDFAWIARDNSSVPMDAQTVLAFTTAAIAREGALVLAARAIKDLDPAPPDVTDDGLWDAVLAAGSLAA